MEQPRQKMQDIHSKIGPGGGLFSGSPSHTLSRHLNGGLVQVLKCPRCDSLDTKFCYYNNYKLSQPRHFCKTCRRYWTKGGLLRNIPLGGGCRKPKRSSKQNSPSSPPPTATADPPSLTPASNSHSSIESSSITVTNATGVVEAGSGFSLLVFEGGSPTFPDLGGLSGLMTSPSSESVLTSLGFGPLDQEMFDLPVISTVDQAYWSQSQWSADDHDRPNLYIP